MEPSKRRRTGCTECRRKKSKCDEKKPVCTRCLKYPKLCSYELSIKTTHFKTPKSSPKRGSKSPESTDSESLQLIASPQACSPISIKSPASDLSDYRLILFPMVQSNQHRFYFHHFISHTASIYFPLQPDALLSFAIPVAENSPPMLAAILAASCGHYFRLKGNPESHTAAIAATVQSLSSLRKAITTSHVGGESASLLATSLMLATTSLCAGDTATYRQHLNGAIHIVQRDGGRHGSDALWSLDLKWLTHLVLMNRVSGLPLPTQQKNRRLDWTQLVSSMPDPGQVDTTTGLSLDVVTILDEVCDLAERGPSMSSKPTESIVEESGKQDVLFDAESCRARSLEMTLLGLKNNFPSAHVESTSGLELNCSHDMFVDATLLALYRRVDGLLKRHEKVQAAVQSIIASLQQIDQYSQANIPLLWPLLAAGCEAVTRDQRDIIAGRMMAMSSHGLGNCRFVYQFMTEYWDKGGDLRWDTFAERTGVDLVLF